MTADIVRRARRALGSAGVLLPNIPFAPPVPFDRQRAAIRALEVAGWPAVWANEGVGGKDVFVQLAMLLSGSERITFGTGVANVWARAPETAHGAAATLADAFPDRLVVGLGVGYPSQAATVGGSLSRPLSVARDYMERMGRPHEITPAPTAPYARILAANGPRMLGVAAEVADGALPLLVPPSYTARVRQILGPDALLVVGVAAAVDNNRDQARRSAAAFLSGMVARPDSPYAANLVRLGYARSELVDGADRVVDEVLAHGAPTDVAALVQRHLDAGADHVQVSPIAPDFANGIDQLERLSAGLAELRPPMMPGR
jgi:probable F420-dependent oxidoreductase